MADPDRARAAGDGRRLLAAYLWILFVLLFHLPLIVVGGALITGLVVLCLFAALLLAGLVAPGGHALFGWTITVGLVAPLVVTLIAIALYIRARRSDTNRARSILEMRRPINQSAPGRD